MSVMFNLFKNNSKLSLDLTESSSLGTTDKYATPHDERYSCDDGSKVSNITCDIPQKLESTENSKIDVMHTSISTTIKEPTINFFEDRKMSNSMLNDRVDTNGKPLDIQRNLNDQFMNGKEPKQTKTQMIDISNNSVDDVIANDADDEVSANIVLKINNFRKVRRKARSIPQTISSSDSEESSILINESFNEEGNFMDYINGSFCGKLSHMTYDNSLIIENDLSQATSSSDDSSVRSNVNCHDLDLRDEISEEIQEVRTVVTKWFQQLLIRCNTTPPPNTKSSYTKSRRSRRHRRKR